MIRRFGERKSISVIPVVIVAAVMVVTVVLGASGALAVSVNSIEIVTDVSTIHQTTTIQAPTVTQTMYRSTSQDTTIYQTSVLISPTTIGSTIFNTITATSTTTEISTSSAVQLLFANYPASLPTAQILGGGSTDMTGLVSNWAGNFSEKYPTVRVNVTGVGSGAAIEAVVLGVLDFGDSDYYTNGAPVYPSAHLLSIPVAISALQISYNIPGMPASMHLNFSGPVLAGIYNGSITNWDDPRILAINSGAVTFLTNHTIIPIHRSDVPNGQTLVFTQYLSMSAPSWYSSVGAGTNISWPNVASAMEAVGEQGVLSECSGTAYSIAYLDDRNLLASIQDGLGYAFLQNQAGNFVNITAANIMAAADQMIASTPLDGNLSLVYAPGANSYPMASYEYVVVSGDQNGSPIALQTFLTWAIDPQNGNSPKFLNYGSFVPLPLVTAYLSYAQINQISGT